MATAFPAATLARSGPLPTRRGYGFELKWDGFRALVCTHDGLRVRSRRGWDMTPLLPELTGIREGVMLDGELVAFGDDGRPSFPVLCDRMLHGSRRWVALAFLAFDLLYLDGDSGMRRPYAERRRLLDELDVDGGYCRVSRVYDDGEALAWAVRERGLEGVVAKRLDERYKPGERSWIKTKNRAYWRYPAEVEAARRKWRSAASTFGLVRDDD